MPERFALYVGLPTAVSLSETCSKIRSREPSGTRLQNVMGASIRQRPLRLGGPTAETASQSHYACNNMSSGFSSIAAMARVNRAAVAPSITR